MELSNEYYYNFVNDIILPIVELDSYLTRNVLVGWINEFTIYKYFAHAG